MCYPEPFDSSSNDAHQKASKSGTSKPKRAHCASCGVFRQEEIGDLAGGITYIGPAEEFPERYYRQSSCGLVQKLGLLVAIHVIEADLEDLRSQIGEC